MKRILFLISLLMASSSAFAGREIKGDFFCEKVGVGGLVSQPMNFKVKFSSFMGVARLEMNYISDDGSLRPYGNGLPKMVDMELGETYGDDDQYFTSNDNDVDMTVQYEADTDQVSAYLLHLATNDKLVVIPCVRQ